MPLIARNQSNRTLCNIILLRDLSKGVPRAPQRTTKLAHETVRPIHPKVVPPSIGMQYPLVPESLARLDSVATRNTLEMELVIDVKDTPNEPGVMKGQGQLIGGDLSMCVDMQLIG